ncbi:BrnA antitoxin family protein [Sinorhizobium sp. A49]|nr:hypothetical protein B0E45_26820 [Sinorhizobium sp. A49]
MAKAVFPRPTDDLVQQVLERRRAVKKKPLPSDSSTTKLTLTLDTEVVNWFKASGDHWRTRMREVLRNAAEFDKNS